MTTKAAISMPLTSALVRIGREEGVELERLRADRLLHDAQTAWPGSASERWEQWLAQSVECVALRSKQVELTLEEAMRLATSGALLVGAYDETDGTVVTLVGGEGGKAQAASSELDDTVKLSSKQLGERLAPTQNTQGRSYWVIVDRPQLASTRGSKELKHKPIRRYYQLLRPERSDIGIILVFAFFVGLLSLATPIAVEALVNTVAFGRLLQPVIILAALLFGFLAFAGILRAVQIYVVEFIQRRMFARVAADLAYRLPRTDAEGLNGAYGPELANRFLDVATLQKVTATLLTDGIQIVLAALVGMTVLAFYHPWLLGFDVLLLILVVAGLVSLGRGAIPAAIKESKLKYSLTSWFEDILRCDGGFKSHGGADFAADRASRLTTDYLNYRKQHFGVFFRQMIFVLGLQAVAGTVLLGGGGWLVMQGELTLGQLVAAELIVATILNSLAKLGKQLDGFYDVVAAVDKLGVLFDLPTEQTDGVMTLPEGRGVRVRFTGVKPSRGEALSGGFDAALEACERVALLGGAGSGKTALMRVLYGLDRPAGGHVEIEHADPRDLRTEVLREHVALAGEPELFEGSVAENVHLHRPGVTSNDVRAALFATGLLDQVLLLPQGLETPINASGSPLSLTQQRQLMIARAIVTTPRLLLVDGLIDSLPDEEQRVILDTLTDPKQPWTLIVATGRAAVADLVGRVIPLKRDPEPKPDYLSAGGPN